VKRTSAAAARGCNEHARVRACVRVLDRSEYYRPGPGSYLIVRELCHGRCVAEGLALLPPLRGQLVLPITRVFAAAPALLGAGPDVE